MIPKGSIGGIVNSLEVGYDILPARSASKTAPTAFHSYALRCLQFIKLLLGVRVKLVSAGLELQPLNVVIADLRLAH